MKHCREINLTNYIREIELALQRYYFTLVYIENILVKYALGYFFQQMMSENVIY